MICGRKSMTTSPTHRLGFKLRNMALALASFASYAEHVGHQGPLTTDVMVDWARQDKAQNHTLGTWARRLKVLRPFTRWLRQFEPRTEVPDASVFGQVPGRVAPHIYREAEIVALLAAARGLNPQGGLRPATLEHCSDCLPPPGYGCRRHCPCWTPMSTSPTVR